MHGGERGIATLSINFYYFERYLRFDRDLERFYLRQIEEGDPCNSMREKPHGDPFVLDY